MATGRSARIIRGPGRLVVNPSEPLDSSAYPHGGVEVGRANMVILKPLAQSYAVEHEDTGEIGDIIGAGQRWVLTLFLRGWDDEAVETLLSRGYSVGEQTQHAVFSVPGSHQAGTSELTHAVSLLFVPNDLVNVPALLCYRAVPDWQDGTEIAFRRGAEVGMPLAFECVRDDDGRILQIGRLHDLEAP